MRVQKLSKQSLDGNMETFLLALLSEGQSYGYQIVQDLNSKAPGLLRTGEGTIYPVLHRLQDRGLISSTWSTGANGRQRRYYRITQKGKRALAGNRLEWSTLQQVMTAVLGPLDSSSPAPSAVPSTIAIEALS